MTAKELMNEAINARKYAYAPYSGFKVGAALISECGRLYTGCNVENAAYSPSNCAERTAFFKAVSEGERTFSMIAIAAGKNRLEMVSPCGVCRQVMIEFCDPDKFKIVLGTDREQRIYRLNELMPLGFKLDV